MDYKKLNSLTKYPSIPTYHKLGKKGKLLNELNDPTAKNDIFQITEKVDGTNGRIVIDVDNLDYFIGSREELLFAKCDRIINPTLGIVDALKPIADSAKLIVETINHKSITEWDHDNVFISLYFEVYGGNIGKKAAQYTSKKEYGARLFDICVTPKRLLDLDRNAIALRRESQDNPLGIWLKRNALELIESVVDNTQCVPILPFDFLSESALGCVYQQLKSICNESRVALDDEAGKKPEGVVIRSDSHNHKLFKLRFEDYERSI